MAFSTTQLKQDQKQRDHRIIQKREESCQKQQNDFFVKRRVLFFVLFCFFVFPSKPNVVEELASSGQKELMNHSFILTLWTDLCIFASFKMQSGHDSYLKCLWWSFAGPGDSKPSLSCWGAVEKVMNYALLQKICFFEYNNFIYLREIGL